MSRSAKKIQEGKSVLDVCCGSRMMWFDKNDERAVFNDVRSESHTLCDGRSLHINPDTTFDFQKLGFDDNSFDLVAFDPPHLVNLGEKSWMAKKYGKLPKEFKPLLANGFAECFRVLKPCGTLIFKWNESQIKVGEILEQAEYRPLFGHRSGKASKTHFIVFIKDGHCKVEK